MPQLNPYTALGVTQDADQETIHRAYRQLARELHPDLTGGDKEKAERFKLVSEAYTLIKDPEKRAHYDHLAQVQGFDFPDVFMGSEFGMLVNRVKSEGISSRNIDSLLKDVFTVGNKIKNDMPERMAKATPGVSPASQPSSFLKLIEDVFGLNDVVDPTMKPRRKRTR